jgi:RHS repeat-associated protein
VFADEQVANPQAAGNVVWPLADNLGTVRDLAVSQNGITSVVNHRVFDSFGNLVSQTNAAVDYLFGFTGFLTDKATGLDMSQTRPYDPRTGQWTQKDRIDFLGRDANLSRYVGNSPTDRTDPTGMWWGSDYW